MSSIRRTVVMAALLALPFGAASACGGEGSSTDCSVSACTVTFDRGVDASASILGVKAELVGVQGNNVTLNVGGQRVTVPANGQQNAGGFNVAVQSVTADNVVVKISQSDN